MAATVPFNDLNVDYDDTEVEFDGVNITPSRGPNVGNWPGSGNGTQSGR